jgi:polar amino acid transport system substrate-binding protein
MDEGGKLTGFSGDLWRSIGEELKTPWTPVVKPSVKDLLSEIRSGNADLGIAAVSITAERNEEFDFSQPIIEAGLSILVRDQTGGGAMPSFFSVVFSPALLQLLGLALLLVLIPAHIVWFAERNREDGLVENRAYFPGILKACWWAAGTLGAQADEMPRSVLGRIVALFWMFGSIAFVAYFTAALTTSLTVQQLQGNIRGPEDLPGKRVATTTGSTSATYLRQKKARVQEFSQIDQAYDALLHSKVDAVVFDAPVLMYYAHHDGKGRVQVAGDVFRKESYGIVFPAGSPLRKRVDSALLKLREDGTYQEIYNRWFSSEGE